MTDAAPLLAVTGLLAAFTRPWWVAGGWAIDALLAPAQRAWLARTLSEYHPDDSWIAALRGR